MQKRAILEIHYTLYSIFVHFGESMKNHYEILQISNKATPKEIRQAYLKLSRQYHPDKVKGSDKEKEESAEIFKKINNSYEILSDSAKKRTYDMTLQSKIPAEFTQDTEYEDLKKKNEEFKRQREEMDRREEEQRRKAQADEAKQRASEGAKVYTNNIKEKIQTALNEISENTSIFGRFFQSNHGNYLKFTLAILEKFDQILDVPLQRQGLTYND